MEFLKIKGLFKAYGRAINSTAILDAAAFSTKHRRHERQVQYS